MSETNSELESALRALSPAPAALNRDRLMYLAGQASRPGWTWKASSGVFAAATVVLAVFLILKPAPEVRVVRVIVPEPAPKNAQNAKPQEDPYPKPEPTPLLTPGNHVPELAHYRLQQQIIRFGEEGLPGLSANPGPPTVEPPLTIPRHDKQWPTAAPMNFFLWQ